MSWEFHAAPANFPRFAREWDALNERLYAGHPYFDSRFIGALLEHFSTGEELLCLHRQAGQVTGALILQRSGWGRWASFRPSQAQVTAVLVEDAGIFATLFRALPRFVWSIELHAVDPRYAPDFSRLGLTAVCHPQAQTIGITLEESFADYWNARPKKLVANIDRYQRRAEKEFGPPRLSRLTASDVMNEGVRRFGEMESAGWKGAAGTAISMDNAQGAFYSDVMRRFSWTGQAEVFELRINDTLASSRLVISSERMVVFLKTTYDEALSRVAPGRILLQRVIENLFARQSGKTIEFYTNATRDQREWATFGCAIRNVQIFRKRFFADVFNALKAWQWRLRRVQAAGEAPDGISVGAVDQIAGLTAAGIADDALATGCNAEDSLDWYDVLQKTVYPRDTGVRFYHASEDGRRPTVLPLRLISEGRTRTIEALSNFYTSLYAPLRSPDSNGFVLRHLLQAALAEWPGTQVMRFAPIDCAAPTYTQLINELRAIGWIPFTFMCFGNWYLRVEDDWEGYLRKRGANLRSTIKRRNKEFAAAGGSLDILTGQAGIEEGIDAFQEVYSASWKKPEPYPDFIPVLIRRLAAKGTLRLGIARLHGRAIAAQLWIVEGGKASIFKLAYHADYAAYSPGTVLTAHLLRHVIEQDRVAEVDFLKGDDKHKRIWMHERRERRGIVAYNPATLVGLALIIREGMGRLAKVAKRGRNELS